MTHFEETKDARNEVEFISMAHDKQMAADDRTKELYFRMHKEMTPALVRILIEAQESEDFREEATHIATAYARLVAANLCAMSNVFCDKKTDNGKHFTAALAESIAFFAKTRLEEALEDLRKTPISQNETATEPLTS
mgnify:CR=1 FL=1